MADDGYGRVTNPERFAVVGEAADGLVAELRDRYDVRVAEGRDVDPELAAMHPGCLRVVRLTPAAMVAAPLTLAWTPFPGVHVRFGRWYRRGFPHCGCDGCGDLGADVAHELRTEVGLLVEGHFVESFDGVHLRHAFRSAARSSSSEVLVRGTPLAAQLGPPATLVWEPWPVASSR